MMVIGLEFVLSGVKEDPGRGGINLAIGITNFIGLLTRTVVRYDANNNIRDMSVVQGDGKHNIQGKEQGE